MKTNIENSFNFPPHLELDLLSSEVKENLKSVVQTVQ